MQIEYRQVRDAIAEIVGTDVGYYQIGANRPDAFMVVPPEPKARWKPHGLEVVINRQPMTVTNGTHGGIQQDHEWEIVLNQWDRQNHDTLGEVRDRILREFTGFASYSYQPQTDRYHERCEITIRVQKYIKG